MKKRWLLLLLCGMPFFALASVGPGSKDGGGKDGGGKCKHPAAGVEEFVFMVPEMPAANCEGSKAFHKAISDFYKWYLQNENKIRAGLAGTHKSRDLVPPLNISWETLQQYFELIKKNYPNIIHHVATDHDPVISVQPSDNAPASGQGDASVTNIPQQELKRTNVNLLAR